MGGVTKFGNADARSVLTPEFLGLAPGFFSTQTEESVRSLEALLRMCFAKEPSAPDLYRMLGYSVSVPPHVRRALLSRSIDNDDLLKKLRKPVFIVHGMEDKVVKVSPWISTRRPCVTRRSTSCRMRDMRLSWMIWQASTNTFDAASPLYHIT